MSNKKSAISAIIIWILFSVVSSGTASAAPMCFNFSQTGYSGGATVTGSFCGNDLNNDGWLADVTGSQTGEITFYSMSFSGNGFVPAFSHTLTDLFNPSLGSFDGLVYRIGTQYLGDDNILPFEGLASGPFGGLFGMPGTTNAYRTGVGPTSINAPYGIVDLTITPLSGPVLQMTDVTASYVVVTNAPVPAALGLLGSALALLGFVRRGRFNG